MAVDPTQQLATILGVEQLPVPLEAEATDENIIAVYQNILGRQPTEQEIAEYRGLQGLTILDVYNNMSREIEGLPDVPQPEGEVEAPTLAAPTTPEEQQNDATIRMAFKIYAKREPSDQEMLDFRSLDPTVAQTYIKQLGEAELAEAAAPAPDPYLKAGGNWIIKFTDDPSPGDDQTGQGTYWLFSTEDHKLSGVDYGGTLIPFANAEAFNNFWDGKLTLNQAIAQGQVIEKSVSELTNPNSDFYNARIVQFRNGINPNGRMNNEELAR